MANETQNNHEEFLAFVNGVSTASIVLAESMSTLNKIYLNFCDHLLETASTVSKKIGTLDEEISELTDSLNIATKKVKDDNIEAVNKAIKEAELAKTATNNNTEDDTNYTAPYNDLSEQMLSDLKIMFSNFLFSQNQMYTSAAAATNTGILKIYNGTKSSKPTQKA